MLKTAGTAALAVPLSRTTRVSADATANQPRGGGPGTPKICLEAGAAIGGTADEAARPLGGFGSWGSTTSFRAGAASRGTKRV